jgi:hypothetical protein
MDNNTASYLIQRQQASQADWLPVSFCESLAFAEMVAAAGIQREIAVSYRAVQLQTGDITRLGPATAANSA